MLIRGGQVVVHDHLPVLAELHIFDLQVDGAAAIEVVKNGAVG